MEDEFEMLKSVKLSVSNAHFCNGSLFTKGGREFVSNDECTLMVSTLTKTFADQKPLMNDKSIVLQQLFVNHTCFSATTIAKLLCLNKSWVCVR